jgi:hypothetical protein
MADVVDVDGGETWDDWVDDGAASFDCVFCASKFSAEEPLHAHLQEAHDFSLHREISSRKLDTYGTIQLVNFLRQSTLDGVSAGQVKQTLATQGNATFQKDEFLKPVVADDPLLYCLDCDSDSSDEEDDAQEEQKSEESKVAAPAAADEASELIANLRLENLELKQQMTKYSKLVRDFVVDGERSAHRRRGGQRHVLLRLVLAGGHSPRDDHGQDPHGRLPQRHPEQPRGVQGQGGAGRGLRHGHPEHVRGPSRRGEGHWD